MLPAMEALPSALLIALAIAPDPVAELLEDLGGDPFTAEDLAELATLDPRELAELARGAHDLLDGMIRDAAGAGKRPR